MVAYIKGSRSSNQQGSAIKYEYKAIPLTINGRDMGEEGHEGGGDACPGNGRGGEKTMQRGKGWEMKGRRGEEVK